jgi:hypothetical protein
MVGGMTPLVEHLPHKSRPSTVKKEEEEIRGERGKGPGGYLHISDLNKRGLGYICSPSFWPSCLL